MHSHATDEALLARFARGDRDALGELAQRYELPLLGLARGMLADREDLAMDAVQETWMKVIRYAKSFHHRSTVKTWLYRITINECKNAQHRNAPTHGLTADATRSKGDNQAQSSPIEHALKTDERRTVRLALQQINHARRAVVLLCYHGGMTHEQAAAILEIPLGTLKSRLHTALGELRGILCVEVNT